MPLVERDGKSVLLDIGSGSIGPLQRLTDVGSLDALVVSHAHQDHCADLSQLTYLRARAGSDVLPVVAPVDLPLGVDFASRLAVSTAREGAWDIGPMRMRLTRVEHTEDSWAVRVDDSLCYTGDASAGAALDGLAEGCRVLLAGASAFDSEEHPGHLSAGDAGRLATRSRARLLVLTHLRPWNDPAALLEEAAGHADCPVVTAATGLRVHC